MRSAVPGLLLKVHQFRVGDFMGHIGAIRKMLSDLQVAGIVIPSTDEFLSEFPPPRKRDLKWAVGFEGSTGLAIIGRNSAALFVDSRYINQATNEVQSNVEVLHSSPIVRRRWVLQNFKCGEAIAIDPWLHSIQDWQQWSMDLKEAGVNLLALNGPSIRSLREDSLSLIHI